MKSKVRVSVGFQEQPKLETRGLKVTSRYFPCIYLFSPSVYKFSQWSVSYSLSHSLFH